jgi:hypothetical protein
MNRPRWTRVVVIVIILAMLLSVFAGLSSFLLG